MSGRLVVRSVAGAGLLGLAIQLVPSGHAHPIPPVTADAPWLNSPRGDGQDAEDAADGSVHRARVVTPLTIPRRPLSPSLRPGSPPR